MVASVRITGSKAHRVWKCPASAVLPQLEGDDSKHEPARQKGKIVHAFLETVKLGEAEALAAAPTESWPLLKALDVDNLPTNLACEVAFAWNWKAHTARELGRGADLPRRPDGGIDYDALGVDWTCEVPGTFDVVGVQDMGGDGSLHAGDRRGYVGDYKSGHVKLPPPDEYGQTLLGGLCVRAVYGCDDVVLELIHIHGDGDHHKVRRTVDEWQLDAFAAELAEAMRAVEFAQPVAPDDLWAGPPAPREGPWCDYCPAFKSCPAKVALVRSIPETLIQLGVKPGTIPDKDGVDQHALVLTPGMISVRNAAAAWMALELIEDVVGRAKAEICSIAAFEPIDLPDGRVIERIHTERRVVDGAIASQVLLDEKYAARYGRAAVDEAFTLETSMDALKKMVAMRKQKGEVVQSKKGSGLFDLMLAEIERRGGVAVNTTDNIRPHAPKKKLTSGGG